MYPDNIKLKTWIHRDIKETGRLQPWLEYKTLVMVLSLRRLFWWIAHAGIVVS
jgi:hypothetical protein